MPTAREEARSKTIVFVSNNAWSVFNFRLDVIRWMLDNGYKVCVLSPRDEYAEKLVSEGCDYVPINFNNRGENPLKDLSFYFQLRRLYRKIGPDFIFHYVAKPNIYGSLAAGAQNIPSVAVITGLGYPFARRNWLFRIIKLLYRHALKSAREVWFLNNEDAKVFVNEKIVGIAKMKVLPGEGVNTEHFAPVLARNPSSRDFQFVMSTRLLKSKGISLYADAARILRKKHYDVIFNLIGFFEDGHPDSIAPEQLDKWKKEGLVNYFGFADDVRPYLSQADCLVFPSYYNEGVPRCLMEAASMELPAVTSFNRGCKEVIHHNVNGYLCNMHDAFDLADKMEKMMNLPKEERCKMGKKGREMVIEKFDVRKIIAEYANTLISAFESPGGPHPTPEKTKTPDETNHGSYS
jgi:glycosyltransferase involved in cell wall biosynthesis